MTHGHGIMFPAAFGMRLAAMKFLQRPPNLRWMGVPIQELSLQDALDYWDAVIATEEGDGTEHDA